MKHPTYYPGYKSKYRADKPIKYLLDGKKLEYLVVVRTASEEEAANIDEKGRFWEIWREDGSSTQTNFPTLDDALRYAETKMALGILGEKE
jgi:hypothetical protein